ncbi:MAG TPA: hemerythrin family protein [Tepidimicrobium sp.]|nr:hemerythrin family protein [Tepidimicrobium sp.]
MMWKERYRIGVDLIDNQHRELFRRLSSFIQVVQNEDPWDQKLDDVKSTLNFMQEYVVYHFEDEERYQREIGYPDYEEHREAHAKFKEEINEYVRLMEEEGFTEESIQELAARLMTWLIMHVGKADQRIGEYAKSREGME